MESFASMLSVEELVVIIKGTQYMRATRRRRFLIALISAVERPIIPDVRFDLDDYNETDLKLKFRFGHGSILLLAKLLQLPSIFVTPMRDRVHSVEALCIVLYRLMYPKRYNDMMNLFGRSRESLCRVFNCMIDLIYHKWHDIIYFALPIVEKRLALYADAIHKKGSPVSCLFGFIDGSKFETCRITQTTDSTFSDMQRLIYSGHKRRHCLNFQAVTAPDGLCIHLWGPLEGARHDTTLLRESKLLDYLSAHSNIFKDYYIFGDPAYGVLRWIFSGYNGNSITAEQRAFNRSMSTVRQSVEWWFSRLKTLWAFVTFKMQQKVMLQNVGKVIAVAMLFTNCDCCVNERNQISSFFGLKPPSLEEYLCHT